MAASRLQPQAASRSRLEDELRKLFAQKLAAGRMLRNSQLSASHRRAEPLDQARLSEDQSVPSRQARERSITGDQASADVRRCFRQQFSGDIAEAALVEDEEVEAGEVRFKEGELLTQGSLRQAQRRTDGEPIGLGVEEHKRAVVAPAGEIKAGDRHANVSSSTRAQEIRSRIGLSDGTRLERPSDPFPAGSRTCP
jgi:hypothetical protein